MKMDHMKPNMIRNSVSNLKKLQKGAYDEKSKSTVSIGIGK